MLGDSGSFWTTPDDVRRLVDECESAPEDVARRALAAHDEASRYNWDDVAEAYEKLCLRLGDGSLRRPSGLSGRRRGGGSAARR